jgi:hypothetical protein
MEFGTFETRLINLLGCRWFKIRTYPLSKADSSPLSGVKAELLKHPSYNNSFLGQGDPFSTGYCPSTGAELPVHGTVRLDAITSDNYAGRSYSDFCEWAQAHMYKDCSLNQLPHMVYFISEEKREEVSQWIESLSKWEFAELDLKFDSPESIGGPMFEFDEYIALSPDKSELALIIVGAD